MDLKIGPLLAVLALASVHLSGRHLTLLQSRFGARFGAVAEGCLLAYVVVDVLPVVARSEASIDTGFLTRLPFTDLAWLTCLGGMLLLTTAEGTTRRRARLRQEAAARVGPTGAAPGTGAGDGGVGDTGAEDSGVDLAFVVTMVAHTAANVNAGLLLMHYHHDTTAGIATVTVLLSVHLALVEREHLVNHARAYNRWGRPLLAAALVAGGLIGVLWTPGGAPLALLRSALAGLLALNVLQHHIRDQDGAGAPGFIAGGLLYGIALSLT